jgi:hypothetical protein
MPALQARPAIAIFTRARSSIMWCDSRVYSFIGTWMFSATVIELNRAPSWNMTPQRRCTALRSASFAWSISTPSTSSDPAAGRIRPMISFSSTDLPVPEPPTTPSTSPRLTSRSSPS